MPTYRSIGGPVWVRLDKIVAIEQGEIGLLIYTGDRKDPFQVQANFDELVKKLEQQK